MPAAAAAVVGIQITAIWPPFLVFTMEEEMGSRWAVEPTTPATLTVGDGPPLTFVELFPLLDELFAKLLTTAELAKFCPPIGLNGGWCELVVVVKHPGRAPKMTPGLTPMLLFPPFPCPFPFPFAPRAPEASPQETAGELLRFAGKRN